MKLLIIVLGAVVLLLCLLVGFLISSYNKLIKQRNDVDEAYATMDVYMKKRYDLIPSLVATVKGYAKHEQETLSNIIALRNSVKPNVDLESRFQSESALGNSLSHLFAVAENYPDLKANANFLDLQKQLSEIELEISNARRYYNAVVKKYNTSLEVFPIVLIANMFRFEHRPLFEVSSGEEREAVQIKF